MPLDEMTMTPNYIFQLSRVELYWLVGSFGITNILILDEAWRGRSIRDYEADLQEGNASLTTRGLIRPSPGFGWQVDRLPAAIVQWMATANSMLRVEHIEKNSVKSNLHIFTSGEQALSIEIENDIAHFVLYKTRTAMKKTLQKWLNIPAKSGKSKDTFSIPQPQTFIPVAWKDPKLAAQILKNNDPSANSKTLIEWAASLKCLVVFSKVQINSEAGGASAQFTLCMDGKSLWGGGVDHQETANHFAMFSTMTLKELDAKINEMA